MPAPPRRSQPWPAPCGDRRGAEVGGGGVAAPSARLPPRARRLQVEVAPEGVAHDVLAGEADLVQLLIRQGGEAFGLRPAAIGLAAGRDMVGEADDGGDDARAEGGRGGVMRGDDGHFCGNLMLLKRLPPMALNMRKVAARDKTGPAQARLAHCAMQQKPGVNPGRGSESV